MILSEPFFTKFSPDIIPYQRAVCDLIRDFDYSKNTLEVGLSGSYGSAKSELLAHLMIRHCVENPGARVCVGRRSLQDLKRTIWREILDHMSEDFDEGIDYTLYKSSPLTIRFLNKSEIIGVSWADKKPMKFRSLKLSMLVVEEIVENDEQDMEAIKSLMARLRRLPKIKQNLFMFATNPDSPAHWVHKRFIFPTIGQAHPYIHVFYSRTEDNPFLDRIYIEQLKGTMSPKEAERYLEGKWNELKGEVIYYEYRSEDQFLKNTPYIPNKKYPIGITFDFNIGEGKPISAIMFQYFDNSFHFFYEGIIFGARTGELMEEFVSHGALSREFEYAIYGDSAGKNRDTRSTRSDYDIIKTVFDNMGIKYTYNVPPANPALRARHNKVNAYCKNARGEVRLFLYQGCEIADEGMRLVKLKKGGNYIEDDSKHYQHITTAIGYAVTYIDAMSSRQLQTTKVL